METCDELEMRCGEVFITPEKLFNFHCSMCHNKYENFSSLLDHISEEHFAYIEWGTDKVKHIDAHHLEESKIDWDEQSEEQNFDIKSEIDEVDDVFDTEDPQGEIKSNSYNELIRVTTEGKKAEDDYSAELSPKLKKRKRLQTKNYNCTFCTRIFMSISSLHSHIMHKHTDDRNFKCDQCNWAFKTNSSLRAHQRRHQGFRNFGCSFCLKKFYTNDELRTHERIHTGEKPYVCTQCGKAFNASGLLTNHMKRHNNDRQYKCDHCEKSFFSTQQMKNHLVVHTGERKHICDVCSAAFASRKTLVRHMKIHVNARENKCDICKAAFNQKQSLVAHMKAKHNVLSIGGKSLLPQLSNTVEGVTTCSQCEMKFATSSLLLEHEKRRHSNLDEDDTVQL